MINGKIVKKEKYLKYAELKSLLDGRGGIITIRDLIVPKKKGETKFIFFSGKGGVGKSTMSCATAIWLAENGYNTLLVTTDPAPNLSDIFNQKIGSQVTPSGAWITCLRLRLTRMWHPRHTVIRS